MNKIIKKTDKLLYNNYITGFILAVILLIIMSMATGLFIGFVKSFRIILGSFYVLFTPGYFLSFVFLNSNNKGIDVLERIALSFALSISIIPLLVFYFNLIGVKISMINVSIITGVFCILSLMAVVIKNIVCNKKLKDNNEKTCN